MDSTPWIPDSLLVELGFRIPIVSRVPDSFGCTPYSKDQGSEFYQLKFPGFWNPDSLTETNQAPNEFFYIASNRPFPSSKESHFQNEAKCETFVVKMRNICIIIENHFHINGFALSLALKVRFFGTRKWPIPPLIPLRTLPKLKMALIRIETL